MRQKSRKRKCDIKKQLSECVQAKPAPDLNEYLTDLSLADLS